MSVSEFYNVDPLEKLATNLFYGWGYNFYRQENQLRADNLLIRSKVSWLLGSARKSVETAEVAYRREFLPTPSREKPRQDPAAVAGAQAIERLSRAIGMLEGQVTSQPVPENNRMTERYREEAPTLLRLVESDQQLVGQSELLRTMVENKSGAWLIENTATLEEGLRAIGETLRNRQAVLFPAG